jgi:hypothetical protein
LVDGRRLLRRFDRGREPHVNVVHKKIIEGYEHLDVIWAMDMIEKVGKEVKEVIWKTAPEASRAICRIPTGCEDVVDQEQDRAGSGHEQRLGDSESSVTTVDAHKANGDAFHHATHNPVSHTQIDLTAGEWSDMLRKDSGESRTNREREGTRNGR